uniref:Large ribosomal subunit protein uL4c n=1 Tax=Neotessella volvocina TaxID=52559 RepID=A0A3G2R0V5_9STRA|nr:ribosomal protein L4 [Neotessella volvocina]
MEEIKILNEFEPNKKSIGLIHKVYLSDLKNNRQYTASTKTKSEVRGGGRKPWKQKGTGRARAGSNRSPLWVGGGVIFGPKPRIVFKKINKKEKKLAILSALYLNIKKIHFLENNEITNFSLIKTKNVIELIKKNGVNENSKILIILEKTNKNFWLASRNLKNITLTTANCLNLKNLLHCNEILLSKPCLNVINSIYGKQ